MELVIKVQNSPTHSVSEAFTVDTAKTTLTIAELITEKVKQEVERYNTHMEASVLSLVVSSENEITLNQKKRDKTIQLRDAEKECYVALEAFSKNRFFIFVNDVQYQNLEDTVSVEGQPEILFLKITPLVGG